MGVIADFERLPGVDRCGEAGRGALDATPDGRAEQVWFDLDAGAIKDTTPWPTPGTATHGGPLDPGRGRADRSRRWTAPTCSADNGDGSTDGDLPARRRRQDPDARHDQAQGREGHHRHRAEGAQEAGRGRNPVARPPVHRQGRGRQDDRRRGTAALAARRGLKTLVLSTDAAHSLGDALGGRAGGAGADRGAEPGLFVQQVDAQRRFERSWREIQDYLLDVLDRSASTRSRPRS